MPRTWRCQASAPPFFWWALSTAALLAVDCAGTATVQTCHDDGEGFPGNLEDTHVLILVSVYSVTIVTGLFLAFHCWKGSGIGLPHGVMFVMWVAIATIGIVAWVVTYIMSRVALEDVTRRLIESTAGGVITALQGELESGVNILNHTQQLVRADLLHLDAMWPSPQLWLASLLSTVGQARALHLVYYGTAEGRLQGVSPPKPGSTLWRNYIGFIAGDTLPSWVRCDRVDFKKKLCVEAVERNCTDPDHKVYCPKSCPSGVQRSVDGRHADYCKVPAGVSALLIFDAELRSDFKSFQDAGSAESSQQLLLFDPRHRPWYNQQLKISWTAPYEYIDGGGIGITSAAGIWVGGSNHLGTVAVDFTLKDLNKYMQQVRNVLPNLLGFLVATAPETLMAHSLTPAELMDDAGLTGGEIEGVIELSRIRSHGRLYRAVEAIRNHFGRLNNADCTVMIYNEGDVVMNHGVKLQGMPQSILIVSLPLSDVMSKADRGSTFALMLTVGLSLLCAIVVFLLISYFMRPLSKLETHMHRVAHMRLEDASAPSASIIREVRDMQVSFGLMVENLKEYKNFLPQSLLVVPQQAGSECDVAEESFSVSGTSSDDVSDNETKVQPVAHSESSSLAGVSQGKGHGEEGSAGALVASEPTPDELITTPTNPLSLGHPRGTGTPETPSFERRPGSSWFGTSAMRYKSVSLALLNIGQFRQLSRAVAHSSLMGAHSGFLERVVADARQRNGIVDEFTGDQVGASFGAVRSCNSHRVKAGEFCVSIKTYYSCTPIPALGDACLVVNAAASSGRALCGNLGCAGMKKFSIIGGCSSLLPVLERWGNVWDVGVLVDQLVGEDSSVTLYARKVATARMFHKSPFTLYELGSPKMFDEQTQMEWMYRLMQADAHDPFLAFNQAFDELQASRFGEARRLLRQCPPSLQANVASLDRVVRSCEAVGLAPITLPVFSAPSMQHPPPALATISRDSVSTIVVGQAADTSPDAPIPLMVHMLRRHPLVQRAQP